MPDRKGDALKSLILFIALLAAGVFPSWADDAPHVWSFVVMGDTRDKTTATTTGISPDLGRLAEAIASEHPDLVIHTGDLINGYYTDKDSPVRDRFHEMFGNWKTAMKPVYDYRTGTGVPIYPVRGNHEDGKLVTDPGLEKAYQEEFGAMMPKNGPLNEKGLTYSFSHKGSRFIALDAYKSKKMKIVRGYVDQEWLDSTLASDRRPFTFAFSHTPAFRAGSNHDSPFPDIYSHAKRRDILWNSFKKGGVLAYFCGHIHFYSRGAVDGIEQVVVGNGGANTVSYKPGNVDRRVSIHYPAAPMAAADVGLGYLVMTVDEGAGKVTGIQKLWDASRRLWVQGDTFSLEPLQTAR